MKRKTYRLHWLETERGHFITYGNTAPWDNKIQIKVPRWIAKLLNHLI